LYPERHVERRTAGGTEPRHSLFDQIDDKLQMPDVFRHLNAK
jgi:hypothetical protein